MTSTMASLSPGELSTLFGALSHPLRLRTVRILAGLDAPLALKDLAVEIVRARRAESQEPVDGEQADRVHAALHHAHVPRLADAGLVDYDESEQRVAMSGSVPIDELGIGAQ